MKRIVVFWLAILFLCGCKDVGFDDNEISCDIVIYGSSPAAISAAVQAKRMGKSVVVVTPDSRIGGLTTGGLGQCSEKDFVLRGGL